MPGGGGDRRRAANDGSAARGYRVWSAHEVSVLCSAVRKHGVSSWEVMRQDTDFPTLKLRSGVQLKDKWRNLIKFNHISPADFCFATITTTNAAATAAATTTTTTTTNATVAAQPVQSKKKSRAGPLANKPAKAPAQRKPRPKINSVSAGNSGSAAGSAPASPSATEPPAPPPQLAPIEVEREENIKRNAMALKRLLVTAGVAAVDEMKTTSEGSAPSQQQQNDSSGSTQGIVGKQQDPPATRKSTRIATQGRRNYAEDAAVSVSVHEAVVAEVPPPRVTRVVRAAANPTGVDEDRRFGIYDERRYRRIPRTSPTGTTESLDGAMAAPPPPPPAEDDGMAVWVRVPDAWGIHRSRSRKPVRRPRAGVLALSGNSDDDDDDDDDDNFIDDDHFDHDHHNVHAMMNHHGAHFDAPSSSDDDEEEEAYEVCEMPVMGSARGLPSLPPFGRVYGEPDSEQEDDDEEDDEEEEDDDDDDEDDDEDSEPEDDSDDLAMGRTTLPLDHPPAKRALEPSDDDSPVSPKRSRQLAKVATAMPLIFPATDAVADAASTVPVLDPVPTLLPVPSQPQSALLRKVSLGTPSHGTLGRPSHPGGGVPWVPFDGEPFAPPENADVGGPVVRGMSSVADALCEYGLEGPTFELPIELPPIE